MDNMQAYFFVSIRNTRMGYIPVMSDEVLGLGTPRSEQQYKQNSDLQLIYLRCQALKPLSQLPAVNFLAGHHEPIE